ncbi:MAG: hypothetical protein LBL66_02720 [Clostridiales bacterium]|nr:hypothetical protein [Clostridiales bacterium]
MHDFADKVAARLGAGDVAWDNPGRTQVYNADFVTGAGIWGLSAAFVSEGYGEVILPLRSGGGGGGGASISGNGVQVAPWGTDTNPYNATPLKNWKTLQILYWTDNADAVDSIDVNFSTQPYDGGAGMGDAQDKQITYAFQGSEMVEGEWAVLSVDMTNTTPAAGTSCVRNTMDAGDENSGIVWIGIHARYNSTTAPSNAFTFKLDNLYISENTEGIDVPPMPLFPTINASKLAARYDIAGQMADLSVITASTLKEDTDVTLSFEVIDPDSTDITDTLDGGLRFLMAKAGRYTVNATAVNDDAEGLETNERFYIDVADPDAAVVPQADKILFDFPGQTYSHNGYTDTFDSGNIDAVWKTSGWTDTDFPDAASVSNGAAAKFEVVNAPIGTAAGCFAAYVGGIPDADQFKPSEYGSVETRFYLSNPDAAFRIFAAFNVSGVSLGEGNKGVLLDINPKSVAWGDGAFTPGWYTVRKDMRALSVMGGFNFADDETFTQFNYIVSFDGTAGKAKVGDYAVVDYIKLIGERHAPEITLDSQAVAPLLLGNETGGEIDLNDIYTVSHPAGFDFTETMTVTYYKGSAGRQIALANNKFTAYGSGVYRVEIRTQDANQGSDSKWFNIEITGLDIPSVPPAISTGGVPGTGAIPLSGKVVSLANVTASDELDPNPVLEFDITGPAGNKLTLAGDKTFTADYNGKYTVVITATNYGGLSAARTINITVQDQTLTAPPSSNENGGNENGGNEDGGDENGGNKKETGCRKGGAAVSACLMIGAALAFLFKRKLS